MVMTVFKVNCMYSCDMDLYSYAIFLCSCFSGCIWTRRATVQLSLLHREAKFLSDDARGYIFEFILQDQIVVAEYFFITFF